MRPRSPPPLGPELTVFFAFYFTAEKVFTRTRLYERISSITVHREIRVAMVFTLCTLPTFLYAVETTYQHHSPVPDGIVHKLHFLLQERLMLHDVHQGSASLPL